MITSRSPFSVIVAEEGQLPRTKTFPFYIEEDKEGGTWHDWHVYCCACHDCLGMYAAPLVIYAHRDEVMEKYRKHSCVKEPK